MTHYGVGVILTLLAIGFSQANGNIFERTFKKLHEEPYVPTNQNRADEVQTLWIEQKLDHFNDSETRTWQMRYMLNDVFFKAGGPMFIYLGGEWAISKGRISEGHMYDMAKEHNGLLAYTEHRYYGESHPLPDLSNDSLQFLHVKQALADLAHFIKTQKASYKGLSDSKVIIVGGSYSAAMVTWFKRTYPDLVAGGWASSAPLFAKVDFVEYKEIAGQSIVLMGGSDCYNRIQKGIAEMEAMFANKRGSEVKALLKLCEPFDVYSDLDVWNLFSEISDIFSGVVQTHNTGQIEGVCQKIMAEGSDLVGLSKFLLSEFGESTSKCNDLSYNAMIDTLSDTRYSGSVRRQWLFQTCNEYGWYQTSGSASQPFGTKFPVTFYTTMCADLYGPQFSKSFIEARAAETNEYFGGLTPKVENVYFSHGQLDPWRAMGIQDEKQATIIPKHAHCADLGSISIDDTAEMRASKERVAELVREWL
ncbi:putative serine protease K12H4.7 isoform X2 [Drosophila mojavensis]|uniref:putative serine protease K12H4.7 isoform X2 n=1 Tax=Drosophila mojavensis TaxID=7230 RepID=UPI001CD164E7|nr:putative serine protease K12H4.7 isoform X2 [Drosophila mojavensis]